MKCYIYKIINQSTGEKYVGQTTNFSRRIESHFYQLQKHTHRNWKLQQAYDIYGKEAFIVTKEKYDLTKEELNELEIKEIDKEDSFNNGYNLTRGGGGYGYGGREKLNFEQFCFAYFGNKKYDGMTARTGQYLGVDSACIAAIRREAAYDYYRMKALQLPEEEKQKYIQSFEQIMDIKNKPPITQKKKLTQEELNIFLSVVSVYGRGAEAAVTRFLGISKGLKHHIVKGEYAEEYKIFKSLDPNLIEQMAINCFEQNNLQQYCTQKIKKNKEIIFPS